MFDSSLIPFFRSRTQPTNLLKPLFSMNLHVFTYQQNMFHDDLHDLFRYLFWHWFLMTVGTDVDSTLESFWSHLPCFFALDLLMTVRMHFSKCWQKTVTNNLGSISTRDTFDDLSATNVQSCFDIDLYCICGCPLVHSGTILALGVALGTLLVKCWSFIGTFSDPCCFLFIRILPFDSLSAPEDTKHLQTTARHPRRKNSPFQGNVRNLAECGT